MRRMIILSLAVLGLVAMVPADVFAQAAPTPQVTINGFIQQVTSYRLNYSNTDLNLGRTNDTEWYTRTRGRFDVTGRLGQVIGRLGIEIDYTWGQAANTDCGSQHTGTNCGFDLNGDMSVGTTAGSGVIELRHLYTQFPVTGKGSLMPFIPVDTTGRFGGQPWDATYKLGILANSDFAGVMLNTTWTPNVRTIFHYAQVEEQVETAARAGTTASATGFGTRGDDHVIMVAADVTPMKGLDIRPLYAYTFIDGQSAARSFRGGFAAANHNSPGVQGNGLTENRHTVGVDARFRMGPLSIEPTVFYQFGDRETRITGAHLGTVGTLRDADISAWFVDVRGGYRLGPLLVEAMMLWTSGNRARDNLHDNVNFYQPIATDTTYYATWAEILALNTDFNNFFTNLGTTIGYDRYGRVQIGARAYYDLTPALTFNFKWTTAWTDKAADNDGVLTGTSLAPSIVNRVTLAGARPEGDSRYIGTELDLGFTWRFAPGVTFDAVYGYLLAGPALGVRAVAVPYNAGAGLPINKDRDTNDVQIFTARVNYSF